MKVCATTALIVLILAMAMTTARMQGYWLLGPYGAIYVNVPLVKSFLLQYALPNFQFHVAMMYGILRHEGVPLGKRDFEGSPAYSTR